MGRKSTKENKTIYQTSRESLGLTRDQAAEKLEFISADRIEKIEYQKSLPHPEEVMAMAIDSLNLLIDQTIATGKIDKKLLKD